MFRTRAGTAVPAGLTGLGFREPLMATDISAVLEHAAKDSGYGLAFESATNESVFDFRRDDAVSARRAVFRGQVDDRIRYLADTFATRTTDANGGRRP